MNSYQDQWEIIVWDQVWARVKPELEPYLSWVESMFDDKQSEWHLFIDFGRDTGKDSIEESSVQRTSEMSESQEENSMKHIDHQERVSSDPEDQSEREGSTL